MLKTPRLPIAYNFPRSTFNPAIISPEAPAGHEAVPIYDCELPMVPEDVEGVCFALVQRYRL